MKVRAIFLSTLLSLLMLLATASLPIGIAQSYSPINWNTNGNYGINWDYVSQSSLNTSNAPNLALKWVLPLPPAPPPYTLNGIDVTPIVVNGIAYFITADSTVYAVVTSTGAILWAFHVNIPPSTNGGPAGLNYHAHNSDIFYSTSLLGQPLIWFLWEGNGYHVYALNAISGSLVVNYTVPFQNLPGVRGLYQFTGRNAILDEKAGILIIGTGSISEAAALARGFFIGLNVKTNPPTIMWETPVMPPQDGSDPYWDIQSINNMSYAWIFNGTGAVNLKALPPSVLNATFYDDWGFARHISFNGTNSFAGTATGWGGPWAVNPSTGVAYVTTDQPSPDFNATFRPGPNLWSDSILAINITTGKYIWGFQTWAHDLEDYDCAWSVMLVNVTLSNGQTQQEVLKGCKNGYFYALDANTGKLLWYLMPPSILRVNSPALNPLNSTQMTKPWMFYPAASGYFNPCGTGGLESDPAYNPQTGLVYLVAYNCEASNTITPVPPTPGWPYATDFGATGYFNNAIYNATIWAVNAATGQPVWHVFVPTQGFRGGIVTTGNLLIVPLINGTLDILDAANGNVVARPFTGAGMDTQPAIASDPSGNILLLQPLGAADAFSLGGASPSVSAGTLVALSLPPSVHVSPSIVCGSGTVLVNGSCVANITQTEFYGVLALAVIFIVATVALLVIRRRPSPRQGPSQ
jgi:outer membrane protein assembly factor BamB